MDHWETVERPFRSNPSKSISIIVDSEGKGKKKKNEDIFIGKALSGDEIKKYLSGVQGFLGTFLPDQLEEVKIPKKDSFALVIFIPDKEDEKAVGHWIAFVVDQLYKEIDFYDSYGRSPKQLHIEPQVEKFVSRILAVQSPSVLLKYKINRIPQQDQRKGIVEQSCGSYVINFILDRMVNHKSFQEASHFNKNYKNVADREKLVQRVKKRKFDFV